MKKIDQLRLDFPIFTHRFDPGDYIYFDTAATAQMPKVVVDEIISYYLEYKSNVDRGLYLFAEKTTQAYEHARKKVADFIGAQPAEIIFTSGATDSINRVVYLWAQHHLHAGDEIIISQIEHHANFLPWQQLAQEKKLILTTIPIDTQGVMDLSIYYAALSSRTKLVAIVHTSNVSGATNDIELIAAAAHQVGAKILVDASQSIAHQKVDVIKLDADFLVFSGHKLYGPTGIGCLFMKKSLQHSCIPFQFGGSMVYSAGFQESFWKNPPYCFEAGTPAIAQAIGLAAAIDYVNQNIDWVALHQHEQSLVAHAVDGILQSGSILISSPTAGHLITFYHPSFHAHDIAMYLDSYNIAVRAGNHCAQPYHDKIGIDATVRVSFGLYNRSDEVEMFIDAMKRL